MRDKKKLIEAALFIAARPMTLAELYHVVGIPKPQIEKLLEEMEKEYDDHGIGIRKREAGYEIHIKEDFKANVEHLAPEKDFSKATLQTLSLIAYHHPAKQSFVVETRGNRAYDHIKELTTRGFIRLEPEGHTNRIHVTKKFLEYFGLSSTAELKDYFKDQGVEPPDEVKWEKTVEKAEEKTEEKKDAPEPVKAPPEKEINHSEKPAPKEPETKIHMPQIDIPEQADREKKSDEDAEKGKEEDDSGGEKKKQDKAAPKKKSVNIRDEPHVSPFSDVIKDDDKDE